MSELQAIESALEKAASRRRWARALRGLWYGLLVGAVLSLLLIGAWHLLPLPLWTLTCAVVAPFPCALAGLVIGGWRKPALGEVARWVDLRQHLQERLSTALEVGSKEEPGHWRELVVTDAAEHIKGVDLRRLVPFHLPKVTRWALIVLVLVAGLGFVPEYRSKSYLRKQAEQQNIKDVGRQLSELTRRNLEKRLPVLEPTQKALESVADLGDRLTVKPMSRSEALKDLANVAERLKDQVKEMGRDPGLRKMEQAARASGGSESQTASGIQKQLDALQKQMGKPVGNPEALDKLKKDLEKLTEAARGLADKGPDATEAERQKLSEALSALSKEMQDAGVDLPQIDEAIQALAANQPGLVLKDLESSLVDLEKVRDMAKQMQQLQAQMEKMGKDLAEQLKNGQPEAAQMTLHKMISQLKSANLSSEQLQKMVGEVSKAIEPAGNYGKVGEKLAKAAGQMKSGDKAGAGQSLTAAAKELSDLMGQVADAQAMLDSLQSLNQASMCIGSGMGWSRYNQPGFNPKGRGPGRGVGTWGDDSREWDGMYNERWDNSGIDREDMDPRGQTDRGEAQLNDALRPTKVKGQYKQGGPMPSITLKGVSIKGQSKVAYEETATAAQSDAQSALSQEKVPRAYQGAVRDYFDNLKK
jgi:hypothetical protein